MEGKDSDILKLIQGLFSIRVKFEKGKLYCKFPEEMPPAELEWTKRAIKNNKDDIIKIIMDELSCRVSDDTSCMNCKGNNWGKVNGRWVCLNCHRVKKQNTLLKED